MADGAYFGVDVSPLAGRLVGERLDDGGWNCERATGGTPGSRAARTSGEEFLLERALFRRLSTGKPADEQFLRFAHPNRWHYDVLEARFAAGAIDTRGFATVIHRLWENLTVLAVAEVFGASPWLNGIPEVCADIRNRGERSVVITMSPDFFARHLLALGFDDVIASRFPPLPFREPLDPDGILTPADKVRIVAELCNRHAFPGVRCVAYGDSMSDAPLFRRLTRTVAVNADHHLAELAAVSYVGDDLAGAYALGRALLDAAEPLQVRSKGCG